MPPSRAIDSDPKTFKRCCAIFSLLFILIFQFTKLIRHDLQSSPVYHDFPQYYMGGLIARTGNWDSLYPIPKPNTGMPGAGVHSTMRPRYAQLAAEHGIGDTYRFTQPPPLAVLLIPLSLLPAHAAFYAWTFLLCLATWRISLQAARIYELCAATVPAHPRSPGLLILVICLSPAADFWIHSANISLIVAWLIGVAVLALTRRHEATAALALTLAALGKYVSPILAPLYLATRQWRTLLLCCVLAVLLCALTLACAGSFEPYRTFFHEIVPALARTIGTPDDQSLYCTLYRLDVHKLIPHCYLTIFPWMRWLLLAVILALTLTAPRAYWQSPTNIFTAALAPIAWLLVFSPICWDHYYAYLAPFWGWLAFQATLSRPRLACAAVIIIFGWLPTYMPIGTYRLPEPLFSHVCWSMLMTLLFATFAMLQNRRGSPHPT